MGIQDIERSVDYVHNKLDAIAQTINGIAAKQSGVAPAPTSDDSRQRAMDQLLLGLMEGRDNITLIKELRTATSLPLKNAKDWVEWARRTFEVKRKSS